ncbi:tetratricopeptide repeat protein 1 [Triplophysa rosa]|uniref:Tetratricopeptide repeat protein 1 n=1 Tax=Triplophysa rosa TaxID=992332 RepID=A0A9W7TH72_TRIRA|nr:tetratricopeptide repeat protein 1 [Triplophysa rosa]
MCNLSVSGSSLQNENDGQLQMKRQSDPEALSATMANTLKVSETRESTADQEEDRFYDCDDTLPEEDTSPAGQTNIQCTETAQSDRLESNAGIEKGNDSDRLGNTYSTNQSCLNTTSAEKTLDSLDSGLKEQNNEDREKWERFADDDGMRDGDSDSEFKEAASTDKVTEFDEEYLRELEKDLTDEEKESRRKESLELKEKENTKVEVRKFHNQRQTPFLLSIHTWLKHVEGGVLYSRSTSVSCTLQQRVCSIVFSNRAAARLHQRLPRQIEERNEKLKEEIMRGTCKKVRPPAPALSAEQTPAPSFIC